MDAFQQIWAYREEVIYRRWFGDTGAGIFTLKPGLFYSRFNQDAVDPSWLHYGVFQCPPHGERHSWLYISSGMSNPWHQEPEEYSEENYSGLGAELVMETPEESPWALSLLQTMVAYNILLSCGRMGDRPLLHYGHRIPLRASITPEFDSGVRNLIVTRPSHYTASFMLSSGRVELLHFIGITDSEMAHARTHGSQALIRLLREKDVYPLTDPGRKSVV